MKLFYTIIILFASCISALAQEKQANLIPINSKGVAEYSYVIPVEETSQAALYLSALEWVNKTYRSGKDVTQTTDKEGGIIIGKALSGELIYNNMGARVNAGRFSYTFSIYCKDNRFKYVIENITYNKGDMALAAGADLAEEFPHNWKGLLMNNKQTKREWKSFQTQADIEFKGLVADLTSYMRESAAKNNW